jgi:hypothetical protein
MKVKHSGEEDETSATSQVSNVRTKVTKNTVHTHTHTHTYVCMYI